MNQREFIALAVERRRDLCGLEVTARPHGRSGKFVFAEKNGGVTGHEGPLFNCAHWKDFASLSLWDGATYTLKRTLLPSQDRTRWTVFKSFPIVFSMYARMEPPPWLSGLILALDHYLEQKVINFLSLKAFFLLPKLIQIGKQWNVSYNTGVWHRHINRKWVQVLNSSKTMVLMPVALMTKYMSSNVNSLQKRYGFARLRSKIKKFCVYWVPDTKEWR